MSHWFVNQSPFLHLTGRFNRAAFIFVWLLTFVCSPSTPVHAEENLYFRINHLVSAWQLEEAKSLLAQAEESEHQTPIYLFTQGRILFMTGRYAEAVASLEAAISANPALAEEASDLFLTAKSTRDALSGMNEVASNDGRFLLRFFEEDRLLVPYLFEVLQATDRALSQDFQFRPAGRIVVEIYPTADYLAKVSSLSEEDIETSGTIALCKYNRLMFTSPRGLVRGYGWRDTVAHEFVHYYVTHYSANTVPIWLHEGIAKFQEIRWRSEPKRHLAPPQEDLLARSLEAGQLITFDQMHPSMAKLPSQEAASLAFAEVHLVIDYLYRKGGYAQLRSLLLALKAGAEMDEALQAAYGLDLDGVWSSWLVAMRGEGFRRYPGLVQRSLKFKRPGEEGEPEAEYDSIEQKEVKDWTHLGELLRARGRCHAALREYRKAEKQGGDGHLAVQNGIAECLLELGKAVDVPAALHRVQDYYPTHLNTHVNLGRAYISLREPSRAVLAFEEAVGINPFHPTPHAALIKLYEELGDRERAQRSRLALELLSKKHR